MKKFIFIAICMATFSCAFKSGDQSGGNGGPRGTTSTLKLDPNVDSDGDGISNKNEVENGTDPLIADVPILESSFIQNYRIEIIYNIDNEKLQKKFVLSSSLKDTDASFNYKVGKLFGVENAMNFASKVGRFSGHSFGEIKSEDYSWVKFPTLDPLALQSEILRFRPIIDGDGSGSFAKFENFSAKITFDSTVKLLGTRFKEIKDLGVNFYYHDIETDSYVLLKNVLVPRTFQRNINEKFTTEIENVPLSFIRDTYLKRGEFLVSEVDNYFIPELNKDFKTLISSVKFKTIPVLVSNPTETLTYYVAGGAGGLTFLEVLGHIFIKNFSVENNVLKRIGQFENNLGGYEHLIELKNKDKLGNWFVLTNKFKEHFMDHKYTPSDQITLSYITGSELSSRTENVQSSFYSKASSTSKNETILPFGVVSPNSKIEFAIKGLNKFGNEVISTPFSGSWSFGGSGNSSALNYSCLWIGNKSIDFDRTFDLPVIYTEEWERLYLVINEERFKLSTLIAEKKLLIRNADFSYLITIDDISKIKDLKQSDENHISLALISKTSKDFQGIKLVSQSGNQNSPWCTSGPGNLTTISLANGQYEGQVSKSTLDLEVLQGEIVNTRMYPNNTGAGSILSLKLMDEFEYVQNFSLTVSSKITNYFN